jgi:hypothetical protein
MSAGVVFYYDLPALQYTSSNLPYQEMIYPLFHRGYENAIDFNTYNNLPSYFIGVIFGYLMVTNQRLPGSLWYIMWAIACGFFWNCILYPYFWELVVFPLNLNIFPTKLIEAVYASYFRLGIAFLFGYNAYAFFNGQAAGVSNALGANFFRPLSRMSYSVYLVNFGFIWFDITNSHEHMPARVYPILMRMVYTIIICWILGYFMYILFEAPFLSLSKSYLYQNSGSKTRKHIENNAFNEKVD